VYDFLLVINSNLDPISHRYWDTATYWPKIANFAHPLSFNAFVRSDTLWIYGKVLRFLKLESSRQPTVKIWWSYLAPFLTDPAVWQTDGQTELRWLRRAESSSCFRAKKNSALSSNHSLIITRWRHQSSKYAASRVAVVEFAVSSRPTVKTYHPSRPIIRHYSGCLACCCWHWSVSIWLG